MAPGPFELTNVLRLKIHTTQPRWKRPPQSLLRSVQEETSPNGPAAPSFATDAHTYREGSCTFHSSEHLVQLCNDELELMKHSGDWTLSQSMADSMSDNVCARVRAQR